MKREDLDIFYQDAVSYLQDELQQPKLSGFFQTLENDPLLKKLYFQLKDVWEFHQIKDEAAKVDLDAAWKKMTIKHHLFDDEGKVEQTDVKRIIKLSRVWQVAASIIVLIGLGIVIGNFVHTNTNNSSLSHVFECPKGDMVKLPLPAVG